MSTKTISTGLVIFGALILILSIAADALGLGVRAGFGWKQIIGVVVGLGIALVGYWISKRKPG